MRRMRGRNRWRHRRWVQFTLKPSLDRLLSTQVPSVRHRPQFHPQKKSLGNDHLAISIPLLLHTQVTGRSGCDQQPATTRDWSPTAHPQPWYQRVTPTTENLQLTYSKISHDFSVMLANNRSCPWSPKKTKREIVSQEESKLSLHTRLHIGTLLYYYENLYWSLKNALK